MSDLKQQLDLLKNKLTNIDSSMQINNVDNEVEKEKLNKRIDEKLNSLYDQKNKSFKLNVGGRLFDISRHVISNCKFTTVLSEQLDNYNNDNTAIFLDINPLYFLYILDIVRTKCKDSDNTKYKLNCNEEVDEPAFKANLVRFFKKDKQILNEIEFNKSKVLDENLLNPDNNLNVNPLPIVLDNNYDNEGGY